MNQILPVYAQNEIALQWIPFSPTSSQQSEDYILREFLEGESLDLLDDSTPHLTGGVLDSIATMKLVAFQEEPLGFQIAPHEIIADLNSWAQARGYNRECDWITTGWRRLAEQRSRARKLQHARLG